MRYPPMDALFDAVYSVPIIDHYAHNLLISSEQDDYDLPSTINRASGPALQHARSNLAHLRALKQPAEVFQCESSWPVILEVIEAA